MDILDRIDQALARALYTPFVLANPFSGAVQQHGRARKGAVAAVALGLLAAGGALKW